MTCVCVPVSPCLHVSVCFCACLHIPVCLCFCLPVYVCMHVALVDPPTYLASVLELHSVHSGLHFWLSAQRLGGSMNGASNQKRSNCVQGQRLLHCSCSPTPLHTMLLVVPGVAPVPPTPGGLVPRTDSQFLPVPGIREVPSSQVAFAILKPGFSLLPQESLLGQSLQPVCTHDSNRSFQGWRVPVVISLSLPLSKLYLLID